MATMTEPMTELDARFSDPNATPTPWDTALQALTDAELYWISTVRRDGRPNVSPLPGVWSDGALHFCTGAEEQKGVNLAAEPHCVLTTGCNTWKEGLDVVVEGAAERVTDDGRLHELARLWSEKYHGDWDFEVVDGAFHERGGGPGGTALVFAVAPTKVLSFAKGAFAQTRYRFR
jgi:hypothetical protein